MKVNGLTSIAVPLGEHSRKQILKKYKMYDASIA